MQRSVLQGSPIGAFLFLLAGQLLHDMLKENSSVKGITMHGLELLITQFADDTTLFLEFDHLVLGAVVRVLDNLYSNTGLQTNYDKTTIYRVGSLANSQAKIYTTKNFKWTNEPIAILGVKIPTSPDKNLTCNINFNHTITKALNVLKQWELRKVTLMGKILLVNTLIASLFVYKFQVLPNITKEMLIAINDMILKFIWSGKTPKISRQILIRDKKQGGLRLVDIESRQSALKVQWLIRIRESNFWSKMFFSCLYEDVGNILWNCNFKPGHIKCILRDTSDAFWMDFLSAWASCNFTDKVDRMNVGEQIIWYNSNILIAERPFIFREAFAAGILYISDILREDGTFKCYEEVVQDFGPCLNWLEFMQICDSIPHEWIAIIRNDLDSPIISLFDKIKNEYKISRSIYDLLISNEDCLQGRLQRWERKFHQSITLKEYINHFRGIYLQTVCTKYRDFQYRLVIGALVTNRKLYLWKINNFQTCSFCKLDIEDELHLFYSCSQIKPIWYAIRKYFEENERIPFTDNLSWTAKNVIFSAIHPNRSHVANFVTTIVKRLIYVSRCLQRTLHFDNLSQEIDNVYNTELNIAKRRNIMSKHIQKWSAIKQIDVTNDNYIQEYLNDM